MRLSGIGAAVCAALAAAALCSSRCSFLESSPSSLTVLTWNLQTLFDDRDDGNEFPGWSVAEGDWDAAGYRRRLRNFAGALGSLAPGGPDVAVLQEVENQRVVDDLAALLPGDWPTRVAAGGEGQALRCAVLSKLPLLEARVHSIQAGAADDDLRPLLEVVLDARGAPLTVLAAHWKSKLGGAEATETLRRSQALLTARRIGEILQDDPGAEVILAGDLNENPDEWTRVAGAYPTALLEAPDVPEAPGYADRLLVASVPEGAGMSADGLALWSPWEEYGGYSYLYGGAEERIDHILLTPGLLDGRGWSFRRFASEPREELVKEDGAPLAWDTGDREGYSDHLPIWVELEIND